MAGELAAHARREAPRECCGVLIGRIDAAFHVMRAVPGRNLIASHELFELDPEDFVRADAEAEAEGLAVVGFYHSHPRGPERLSKVDRERAWPGYLQVLIVLQSGSGCGFSGWVAPSERAEFIPVRLEPEDFSEKVKPGRQGSISVCERDDKDPRGGRR